MGISMDRDDQHITESQALPFTFFLSAEKHSLGKCSATNTQVAFLLQATFASSVLSF